MTVLLKYKTQKYVLNVVFFKSGYLYYRLMLKLMKLKLSDVFSVLVRVPCARAMLSVYFECQTAST